MNDRIYFLKNSLPTHALCPPPLILRLTTPEHTPSSAGWMAQVVSQMLFRARSWSHVCKGQSFRLRAGAVPCPELRANSRRGQGREQRRALPSEDVVFQTAVQILVTPVPGTGSLRDSRKVPASDSKLLPACREDPLSARPTSTFNLPFPPKLLVFLKERQSKRDI